MRFTLIALSLLVASSSYASIFEFKGTVGGTTVTRGYDSFEDAYNSMKEENLQTTFSGYNGTQAASFELNFRGVPVTLAYPSASTTTLIFNIPALGINQTFTGATRKDSEQLWTDYLKNNTDLLEKLQKELVKSSPIDPIAGNPNSLMSRSVQMDYDQMLRSSSNQTTTTEGSSNRLGAGLAYGQMTSDGQTNAASMKSTSYTLPLSYVHQFGETNHELYINMPLTYTTIDSAKVYDFNLSVTYRRPITENWVLSGTAGARATGSVELASLGTLGNIAIMSSYTFSGSGWQTTVGNMISQYQSLTMRANGNSYNPNIQNTVYRNGVLVGLDSPIKDLNWEFSLVDTRFKGTELFNQYQDELGITFGTRRAAHSKEADFRGGFTYIKAEKANGFRVNFGAWF